jgi:NAD(P)-dependent dehydrogenase (short-subunit alcohol dehydrogenase family)
VVCADIDGSAAGKTAEEIRLSGGRADGIRLDVTKPAEVQECFRSAADRLGSLDILVNNAGVEEINDFLSVTEEQYDKIMAVNLRGVFFCAQAAARIMVGQGRGKIVNIGSLGSAIGLAKSSVYLRYQGRCGADHKDHGHRAGTVEHPGERHGTRILQDTHDRALFP